MDYVIILLGLTALTKGVPYLLSPKRAREQIKRWLKHDDTIFRAYGVIACSISLIIIYLGL